jgi:hypothetical protein
LLFAGLDLDKAHGGPVTASQIALASAASFFCRTADGFTLRGGINHTLCPSFLISRPKWWAAA